jgi:hypothetical protein
MGDELVIRKMRSRFRLPYRADIFTLPPSPPSITG